MNMEHERKWLVNGGHGTIISDDAPYCEITQAYFGPNTRIRITEDTAGVITSEITIKVDVSSVSRKEYTITIDNVRAGDILADLNCIHKRRYELQGGFTLDVFRGELDGLCLIEKEYRSEQEARADSLPEQYFGVDVTSITTFRNFNLYNKRWDVDTNMIIGGGYIDNEVEFVYGDVDQPVPNALIIP